MYYCKRNAQVPPQKYPVEQVRYGQLNYVARPNDIMNFHRTRGEGTSKPPFIQVGAARGPDSGKVFAMYPESVDVSGGCFFQCTQKIWGRFNLLIGVSKMPAPSHYIGGLSADVLAAPFFSYFSFTWFRYGSSLCSICQMYVAILLAIWLRATFLGCRLR